MGKSFKKNCVYKGYRRGMKQVVRKQSRKVLGNMEVSNGSMYKKSVQRYDFISQRSRMTESEFDNRMSEYYNDNSKFYNSFYSAKYNYYRAYKYK